MFTQLEALSETDGQASVRLGWSVWITGSTTDVYLLHLTLMTTLAFLLCPAIRPLLVLPLTPPAQRERLFRKHQEHLAETPMPPARGTTAPLTCGSKSRTPMETRISKLQPCLLATKCRTPAPIPPTHTPLPTPIDTPIPAVCSCAGNIYNCSDFSTHTQAQACYEYCKALGKGDIHCLDRDNNGLACESLP